VISLDFFPSCYKTKLDGGWKYQNGDTNRSMHFLGRVKLQAGAHCISKNVIMWNTYYVY
jgi:hypothetical protein